MGAFEKLAPLRDDVSVLCLNVWANSGIVSIPS